MAAPRLRPHDPLEFRKLLEWVSGARSLLEIGSRFGYPLADMARMLKPKSRVVSVDLPDAEGWNDELSSQAIHHLRRNIGLLKEEGFDAHLFEADSHDLKTVSQVARLGPFDVVFIDGDHSYKGVKLDWKYYGPMGKVVIFHDIRQPRPPENMDLEVWKFWDELKAWSQVKAERTIGEFIAPGSKMGLGRVE
jgi:predicted O-methyltransferase YrrM